LAGLVLVVGGLLIGAVPVGDGCGSAFSPSLSGAGSDSAAVECSVALSARPAAAWSLIVVGLAAVIAGGTLSADTASPRRVVEAVPGPQVTAPKGSEPNY
jgi:hypothetical protein